jgi:phage terminase large subunit-like protein
MQPLRYYCPHRASVQQRQFLNLYAREAFYGGAAGGGKSDALLMAALQYVNVPGYAALILRRDTQRLKLAGGLIPRSAAWLSRPQFKPFVKYSHSQQQWTFATDGAPATLTFGYLMDPADRWRYGSSEFQYIAFDELTEFEEEDYLFLFSRLRRTQDMPVPLRMRSASNPGGAGHGWVKQRFIASDTINRKEKVHWHEGRAFVPAKLTDNPALDVEVYTESLQHLPPVLREQLLSGDWSVHEEGMIRRHWLRYYRQRGEMVLLADSTGSVLGEYDSRQAVRFATIDPAGTSAERARKTGGSSYSVIQVWEVPPEPLQAALVLREYWRKQAAFDELVRGIQNVFADWRLARLFIEGEKLGTAVVDLLADQLPIETISPHGGDKLARAARLLNKLERGEVFLPAGNLNWLPPLEAEWLRWRGLQKEASDQVDAAAYAAIVAERLGAQQAVRVQPVVWE